MPFSKCITQGCPNAYMCIRVTLEPKEPQAYEDFHPKIKGNEVECSYFLMDIQAVRQHENKTNIPDIGVN
jgi:hypothetical protein